MFLHFSRIILNFFFVRGDHNNTTLDIMNWTVSLVAEEGSVLFVIPGLFPSGFIQQLTLKRGEGHSIQNVYS